MACSHTKNCQLYAQFAADASLKLWKQHFCEDKYQSCARYQLALEGKAVPLTLLPNGKMVERRSKEQISASALFNAIQKQRVGVVRSLIKTGMSSYNLKCEDGMTPLMVASSVGNPEMVSLLLNHDCDPYMVNKEGKRAIDIASDMGHKQCRDILEKFMQQHPKQIMGDGSQPVAPVEDEEIGEVVGFLRRLNPFRSKGV